MLTLFLGAIWLKSVPNFGRASYSEKAHTGTLNSTRPQLQVKKAEQ